MQKKLLNGSRSVTEPGNQGDEKGCQKTDYEADDWVQLRAGGVQNSLPIPKSEKKINLI